jgi:cyclophilin family peptidyl-prolyl cis-trans isomerase/HEAT repeat protein
VRSPSLAAALLFPALLSLGGCSGSVAPNTGTPDAPADDLALRAVLLSLVDQQLFEPVIVRRGLTGPPAVRRATPVAVGRIGDPDGLESLYALLVDDDAEVRRAAAFALGEVLEAPELTSSGGGTPEAKVRAAARLLDALDDPDREVGRLAVEALGKGGVSVTTVAGRLAAPAEEEEGAGPALSVNERQARLLPALFRFPEPAAVPLAAEALALDDAELRRRAAYALTREPLPEGLPHVRALLTDPDPRIRAWAARAVGRIGDSSDLPRLFLLLADDDPGPVIQALRAGRALAAAAGAPPEWRGPIAKLVADPRPGVRVTAIEAAAGWLPEPMLGRLLAGVAGGSEASSWERGAALVALAAGGDPRAPGLAAELAGSDDESLRARAAEAAGILAEDDLLEILADDRSARVRQAVLAARLALAEEGGRGEGGEAIARAALRDRDSGVRTTVLGWLADHPVLPLPELAPVFDPEDERERTIEERLGAVDALAALAADALAASGETADPAIDPAVALLLSVTEAAELPVRRRAVEALAALGLPRADPGHHATRLPPGVYATILEQTSAPRTVEMVTRRGAVTIRLDCPRAPLTCLNFLQLVRQGFYDGLTVHRVVPDFVVQGGDPRGDGWGGPGYTVRDEIGRLRYDRGVVGMALAGPDTGGSQFFVTLSPQPHLDGGYTAFGEVVAGMEVLDDLRQGDRIVSIREVP